MISKDKFKIVVENAPLVSVDLIAKYQNKVLLGKRANRPAFGFFFTTGSIVRKNETIKEAQKRVARDELGIELNSEPKFLGVFEHFYDDSIFENLSTHYINLGYLLELDKEIYNIPKEQHSEYRWFEIDELINSSEVHEYVKNYFRGVN